MVGGFQHRSRTCVFLGLTLVVSVPFYLLNLFDLPAPPGLPPSAAMVFAPMLIALVLACRDGGRSQALALLGSALDLRRIRGRRWTAFALLVFPVLAGCMHLATMWADPVGSQSPGLPVLAAAALLAVYVLGAMPEEIGWSGYATAPLQQRYGVVTAGVLIGAVWQLWHVIPHLSMGQDPAWILGHGVASIGARVIMGVVFARAGGSVFLASVMHALLNLSPHLVAGGQATYAPWALALLTWAVVLGLVVARPSRSDQPA